MKPKTIEDLYVQEMKDLYDGEKQILKALPKMAKASTSEQLRAAFEQHLEQTRKQVERLEQIFEKRNQKPTGKKCVGMQGIIEEGSELMGEVDPSPLLDAGLIAAAQRVEHYEMAGYGTVCAFAQQLGDNQALKLLRQTLDEEKATDEKLTHLAESMVNQEAVQAGTSSQQG
ncbi:MAG: ferritin-like domain-containing protein [Bryobacteraceae bacterium]